MRMTKRILATILTLAMALTVLPATALAEEATDSGKNNYYETDAVTDPAVAEVQALIDALPAVEDITADNAGEVAAQLDAIDKAKAVLSDEQMEQLDFAPYAAAAAALSALAGQPGVNEPELLEEKTTDGGTYKTINGVENVCTIQWNNTDLPHLCTLNFSDDMISLLSAKYNSDHIYTKDNERYLKYTDSVNLHNYAVGSDLSAIYSDSILDCRGLEILYNQESQNGVSLTLNFELNSNLTIKNFKGNGTKVFCGSDASISHILLDDSCNVATVGAGIHKTGEFNNVAGACLNSSGWLHVCDENLSADLQSVLKRSGQTSLSGAEIYVTDSQAQNRSFNFKEAELQDGTLDGTGLKYFKNPAINVSDVTLDLLTVSNVTSKSFTTLSSSSHIRALSFSDGNSIQTITPNNVVSLVLGDNAADSFSVLAYNSTTLEEVDASNSSNLGTLNLAGSEKITSLQLPTTGSKLTSLAFGPDLLTEDTTVDLSSYSSLTTLQISGTGAKIIYPSSASLTGYTPVGSGAQLATARISTNAGGYGFTDTGSTFSIDANGTATLSDQYVRFQMGAYTDVTAPRTQYLLKAVSGSTVDAMGIYYNGNTETSISGFTGTDGSTKFITTEVPANAIVLASEDKMSVMVLTGATVTENDGEPTISITADGTLTSVVKADSEGDAEEKSIKFTGTAIAADDGGFSTTAPITVSEKSGLDGEHKTTMTINPNGETLTADAVGNIFLPAGTTISMGENTQILTNGGTVTSDGIIVAEISISAFPTSLTGGGLVTLTVSGVPAGSTVTVTCDNTTYNPTLGADGRYTVSLPNSNAAYTFTASYAGDANHETASAACTVTVTMSYPYVPVAPTQPTKPAEPDQPDTPVIPGSLPFVDVGTGDWFYEDVAYVYAQGIMTGSTATSFAPNNAMTRAMVWTVLGRMSGASVEGGSPWYALAQAWAASGGVSDGTEPNSSITREQLVTMLYRQAGSPEVGVSELALLGRFTDGESVSAWAEEAMAWAVAQGVLTGDGDLLKPQAAATRAQVAAILARYHADSKN